MPIGRRVLDWHVKQREVVALLNFEPAGLRCYAIE